MRKLILGATALLAVVLIGGCKDAPAVQTVSPVPAPAEPGAGTGTGLATPPKAGADAAATQPADAAGGGTDGAAAPEGTGASADAKPESVKPPAAPSASTGSKPKAELPKAELPKLDEPPAKQPSTVPMLEPPKASGSAASEDNDGSKPATAPMPTDLVTPPMAGSSSSSSAAGDATGSSASLKAETLYKDNCMVCHGDKLQGDVGPALTKVGSRLTKEQLIAAINRGGKTMPPFQKTLKAEQIDGLAQWLSAKK